MNAAEARAESERHLKTTILEPLLTHVYEKILEAAKKGRFSIQDPHQGYSGDWPSLEVQNALWAALSANGYKVVYHPDPDPGHPCSHDYHEVSW